MVGPWGSAWQQEDNKPNSNSTSPSCSPVGQDGALVRPLHFYYLKKQVSTYRYVRVSL